MNNNINSKQKGNVTELKIMLAFIEKGYSVSIPYGDCDRYDFVVDINGRFYRIQCKTSRTEDDGASIRFCCRSTYRREGHIAHHNYSENEIDFFATFWDNKVYLVSVNECHSDKKLRILPPKNGTNNTRINWAKNYELEEVIKTL